MQEVNFTENEKLVLSKIKDLFEFPGHWTSDSLSRDFEGNSCQPQAPKAVCWCLLGALDYYTGSMFQLFTLSEMYSLIRKLSQLVQSKYDYGRLDHFNDEKGREGVIDLLQLAIS